MEMNIIEMPLEPRICECCGSTDLESVWTNENVAKWAIATNIFNGRVIFYGAHTVRLFTGY